MSHWEVLGDGCIAKHNDVGGIVFTWYQKFIPGLRRPDVWDHLQHDKICPHCGYSWQPRTEHPKSCPMCRSYLVGARKVTPVPEGYERIENREWALCKYLKTTDEEE